MDGPLAGIKVVDLTIAVAGPFFTRMLADQGASVIKVEPPGTGDIGRHLGVPLHGVTPIAQMSNRGKRSIAINLRVEEGRSIVRDLAREADVFSQNFRPGVIEEMGLGYESLRKDNPELVYASISGFGEEGPYSRRAAFDPVIQAYAGLAALQGGQEGKPELLRMFAADKITALTASQAVTAALFARARGAGGQLVRLSMLEAVVNFVWVEAAGNEILRDSDGQQPFGFRNEPPWPTLDGSVVVAAVSDSHVAGVCRQLGVEGWDDPRLSTFARRRENSALFSILMERARTAASRMSTAELLERFEVEGVPCGPTLSPEQLSDDPHVKALGMLKESVHPLAGRMLQPRPAPDFERTPASIGGAAPSVGQQTDEILAELGRGDSIARLRDSGVVA